MFRVGHTWDHRDECNDVESQTVRTRPETMRAYTRCRGRCVRNTTRRQDARASRECRIGQISEGVHMECTKLTHILSSRRAS